MSAPIEKSSAKKTLRPAENGHKELDTNKWYGPGEKMSKGDRLLLELWTEVYENRKHYKKVLNLK